MHQGRKLSRYNEIERGILRSFRYNNLMNFSIFSQNLKFPLPYNYAQNSIIN